MTLWFKHTACVLEKEFHICMLISSENVEIFHHKFKELFMTMLLQIKLTSVQFLAFNSISFGSNGVRLLRNPSSSKPGL